jgi:hypothetical protein
MKIRKKWLNQLKKSLTNIFKNIICHLFAGESHQVVKITGTYNTYLETYKCSICTCKMFSRIFSCVLKVERPHGTKKAYFAVVDAWFGSAIVNVTAEVGSGWDPKKTTAKKSVYS